ncbi:hypothetical protein HPB51_014827 [Rhipicephalus microplus]|uniref:Pancreatic trypsin inhibitor n=1 Tax=Rhipicephalus microplus TaxID=6941 RepID=A0A9J6DP41_RHIMP|nr:hypothetical protein HPB51_014827 [Rhipicephalus microplus]
MFARHGAYRPVLGANPRAHGLRGSARLAGAPSVSNSRCATNPVFQTTLFVPACFESTLLASRKQQANRRPQVPAPADCKSHFWNSSLFVLSQNTGMAKWLATARRARTKNNNAAIRAANSKQRPPRFSFGGEAFRQALRLNRADVRGVLALAPPKGEHRRTRELRQVKVAAGCTKNKARALFNPDDRLRETALLLTGATKEKRFFPVPTSKRVFMFIGVAMIIAVLGTAGYIFYKGPDSKTKHLVASEPPTNPPAEGRGQKRRNTQTMGPQDAPLVAEADDDDADIAEQVDDQVFNEDPYCTTSHNFYKCEGNEQPEMFLSHLCLNNSNTRNCFGWRPQRFCLTSQINRFRSLKECEDSCNGDNNCGTVVTCECSGLYRKVNYVYDMRRQRCRLIPLHECVEVDVGFADNDECLKSCGSDTTMEDARCKLAALEDLVRPCIWEDKVYTHYYDARSGQCQPWDESVCSPNVFRRLGDCFKDCPRGVIDSSSQPENGAGKKVRR